MQYYDGGLFIHNTIRSAFRQFTICCHASPGPQAQQHAPDISLLKSALQEQWDQAATAHMGNIIVKANSKRKAWWTCDQCSDGHLHIWESTIIRTQGSGCPQCTGRKVCHHNSLATKTPWAAAQWDYEANEATPDTIVWRSRQPVGWLCHACSHRWYISPDSRMRFQSGCPQCAPGHKRPQVRHPTRLKPKIHAWHRGTTSAMQLREGFSTTQGCRAQNQCFGFAASVQQGKSTAGQYLQTDALLPSCKAVPSVLAGWHANATLCKLATLK